MKPKIAIIGASGMIGKHLFNYFLEKNYEVIGTYNKRYNKGMRKFDLSKPITDKFKSLIKDADYAILCSFITDMDWCKKHEKEAYEINVKGMKRLLSILYEMDILPIFLSSDSVFDGKTGDYSEYETPHPILNYTKHKYEIEEEIRSRFYIGIILRLGRTYDVLPGTKSLITNIIKDLKSGECKAAIDQKFNFTYVGDVCKMIECLIKKRMPFGTFHAVSNETFSRYDLTKKIMDKFKIKSRLIPCKLKDLSFLDKRPKDVTLKDNFFSGLMKFKKLDQMLNKIKR